MELQKLRNTNTALAKNTVLKNLQRIKKQKKKQKERQGNKKE